MDVKTSESSPIRVDFLPGVKLGLTFAPGKKGPANFGNYRWDRDLEADLTRLAEHYGIDVVVTLIEAHEFELLSIPDLRDRIRAHDMQSHWLPIPDQNIPPDRSALAALVRTILSALRTGDRVAVHCRGGLGRAGTVAACVLVAQGKDADAAINIVREARPNAIETPQQEAFVYGFQKGWKRGHSEAE